MRPRRAIVLAASRSRLGPLGADRPTAMQEVAGRALIDHQLDALADCGVRKIWIVAGPDAEGLREHVGSRATLLSCVDDEPRSALRSHWLSSPQLRAGAIVLEANVLFAPRLLRRLLASEYPDALLLDSHRPVDPRRVQVQLAGSFVIDLGRHLPPERVSGECVGLLKLGPEGGRRLVEVVTHRAGEKAVVPSPVEALAALAHTWPLQGLDTEGLPWARIDNSDDLDEARRVVAPHPDPSDTETQVNGRRSTGEQHAS